MKKIYRIRISKTSKPAIWYHNKAGAEYDAELKARNNTVVFEVNPCQFVHLVDCEVIGERLAPTYSK